MNTDELRVVCVWAVLLICGFLALAVHTDRKEARLREVEAELAQAHNIISFLSQGAIEPILPGYTNFYKQAMTNAARLRALESYSLHPIIP